MTEDNQFDPRADVDEFARRLLHDGKLLTWAFTPNRLEVVFFVPDDCASDSYPESIGEYRVVVTALPRPLSEGRQ